MIICYDPQFVFLRNPKTASRSITELIKNHWTVWECTSYHGWKIPNECKNFFIFMVVRNPFIRTFSAWRHLCEDIDRMKRNEKISFYDFVLHGGFNLTVELLKASQEDKKCIAPLFGKSRPFNGSRNFFKQSSFLNWCKEENNINNIKIIKYENIKQELSNLPFMPPNFILPEIGKSKENNWRKEYTPEIEKIAREKLKEDFETFGYYDKLNITI